ncbi:MAG TPA: aspartyl protease family protein [Pyrinomonadaceae bacterium]|nr:aspartyl protease family protein [Pyrinomonadaceae bacterium]
MRKLSRSVAAWAFACGLTALLCAGGAEAAAIDKKALQRAERSLRSGEFEEAEKSYRELLGKDPRDLPARLGLSHALLKQRKYRDAFDHAARAVAADPTSARGHALLGAALLGGGDFALSVEEFRTALSFKDDEALAVAGLAMVDFYENRAHQSLEGMRRAAFLDAGEPDHLFHLGQIAARYERYREAADAYENFLRIAPRTDADRRARIRGLIDFLRYLGRQSDLINVVGPSRVTVPFELVNNRPMLTVRINGSKEPLRFVLDTGAGMCVISRAAAERLGIKPVARGGLARAVGGEGRFEIVYGFLQSLQLGEARIERLPVYIREFHSRQEPVDGYLGLSVVSKYLTTVDYGARTMLMLRSEARTPHRAAEPAAAVEVPIRVTSSGFWSGQVRLEGVERPVNFIVDTGATISVVSETLAARESLDRFAQSQLIRVYGAAGISENIRTLLLPRLFLTPAHSRRHVSAAVLDMEALNETAGFEQTGIVGGNVLRHYSVTFDFERGVVRLVPLSVERPEAPEAPAQAPAISTQP